MEETIKNTLVAERKQSYQRYKDSGVEWLGEIPEHWEVKKLKFVGDIYAGISGKKGDDFSKEYSEGIKSFIPFTNICNNLKIDKNQYQYVKIDERENQNRVKKNDILFLMSSETLDDIAKCSIYLGNDNELYLNSFCKGFRITNSDLNPEYVNYLLSSRVYRNYFSLVGRGFTRINLKQEYINDAIISIPPLPEQTAIANFLDDKTAKIDQAIGIKEQQIALLKERKQILIHKAVTRGLDDNVPLKDSGVEWIGEIPEHWEVKRIKHVTNKIGSGVTPSGGGTTYLDEGIPLLRSQNIFFDKIELDGVAYISDIVHHSMSNSQVFKGDVLLNITGGSIGRCYYVDFDIPLNVNQHVCILRPNNKITTLYLNSLIASEIGQNQIWFHQQGGGREGLNFQSLKNFSIPYPPLPEQKEISDYIETASQKIETAISLKQQEIEKLKEYKSSLINSVVTGKVRV